MLLIYPLSRLHQQSVLVFYVILVLLISLLINIGAINVGIV